MSKETAKTPVFTDNPVALAQPERYVEIRVDATKVLQDWRRSLMAHELMDSNGFIKGDDDISEAKMEKREAVRLRLAQGLPIEKPVLGIGMFDNIEIGAGSDILTTLVMEGVTVIPIHVRSGHLKDLAPFKI